MPYRDSLDKIVTVYLAGVCASPFEYKGKSFEPRPLHVSPLLLRGYTCPATCGGCCPRFTLDYLPGEAVPYPLEPRHVHVGGRVITVFSDVQGEGKSHFCRNLDKQTGRCSIHDRRPFSCDFELIRFLFFSDRVVLTQKLFGRGWAMQRVDGGRGSRCDMLPADDATVAEVVRKLERLRAWADSLSIPTRLDPIIAWAERRGSNALVLDA